MFHLTIKGVLVAFAGTRQLAAIITKPLVFMYRNGIRSFTLHAYLGLFSGKKFFKQFAKQSRNISHNLINQRITIYVILGFVTLFTLANNMQAKDLAPEKLGQDSIMFALVAKDTAVGIIEDTTLLSANTQEKAVTQESAVIGTSELLQEPHEENTVALTQGGSALLASNQTATPHTRTGVEYYTIQPGDTVTSIAKQFSISINSILWSNKLSSYSIIRPGDTIKILPTSGLLHEVSSGDTVSSLAQKYQTSEDEIIATNNLDEANLSIGVELIIPGGTIQAPVLARTRETTVATTFTPPGDIPAASDSGAALLWPAQSHRINQYWNWRHRGIDINGKWGDPIYASEAGTVERANWNSGGYGYNVIVDHGNGIKTLYAHNSKNLVNTGDSVTRGQLIGYIGSTGRSTGPHIHYEVRVNGRTVNPLLYTK